MGRQNNFPPSRTSEQARRLAFTKHKAQTIFNPVRRCRGGKPTKSSNYFCEIVAAQTSIMSFTTGTHLDSSYSEVRSFLVGFVPFPGPDLPGEIIKQLLKF